MKADALTKKSFNVLATHPLQAYEWGEFRQKTGVKVIRKLLKNTKDAFQLTIHTIPHTPWNVGYFPKGTLPTKEIIEELKKIGKEENCIFIQLEPNIKADSSFTVHSSQLGLRPSFHPLFTKHTFQLDLTKSEEELLKSFHPKTRYNIRIAQKHDVKIVEENSDEAFEEYLRLTKETTKRQNFYAHTQSYHRLMWQTLRFAQSKPLRSNLVAHLLIAKYNTTVLVAWILFSFHDTLYYPYGASSSGHREFMASNLMMWETIRFGKKLGLKKFDMWGALGPNPDKNDPWYGFHRFKEGYGSTLITFAGSYDLIINPYLYQGYKIADMLRWFYLRIKK